MFSRFQAVQAKLTPEIRETINELNTMYQSSTYDWPKINEKEHDLIEHLSKIYLNSDKYLIDECKELVIPFGKANDFAVKFEDELNKTTEPG